MKMTTDGDLLLYSYSSLLLCLLSSHLPAKTFYKILSFLMLATWDDRILLHLIIPIVTGKYYAYKL